MSNQSIDSILELFSKEHFQEALDETKTDAVAAANIFHYRDQSVYLAKKYLHENKSNIRKPDLLKLKNWN